MAACVHLLDQMNNIANEHLQLMQDAELSRDKEYFSAVRIQAWYRGLRIRSYLRFLNQCAVNIQRRWRGFQTRSNVRQKLKDEVKQMKIEYYMAMATKIQKTWKGYRSRKYVFSFSQRKKYFNELSHKNEVVRNELTELSRQQAMNKKAERDHLAEKKLKEYARRHHHLVSTVVVPGVYNSPFQLAPNELEDRLRNVKPDEASKSSRKTNSDEDSSTNQFDPSWTQYNTQRRSPLPPVKAKPMGPFKEPLLVQQQRYKPFQPSLRVMTDYFSVEEARKQWKSEEFHGRIANVEFLTCSRLPSKPYEPQLSATVKYGRLSYGTQNFREEIRDVWLTKNFRTVVPPIPVFDRFNNTYSQGTV